MMNSPKNTHYQARLHRENEARRRADERDRNIMRIIAYNNRRIRAGLRPLDIPPKLGPPSMLDWYPEHRDDIELDRRGGGNRHG